MRPYPGPATCRSTFGYQLPYLGHGVAHEVRQILAVLFTGPASQRDTEHRHAGLGRQGRLRLAHPSNAQGGSDGGGLVGQLGQLSLAQFGVGRDHGLALARQVAAELAEDAAPA